VQAYTTPFPYVQLTHTNQRATVPRVAAAAKIQHAVRECLAFCLPAGSPFAQIEAYIDQLRAEGWEESEVQEVHSRVRHFLAMLADEVE
jgi:hypothetical protein